MPASRLVTLNSTVPTLLVVMAVAALKLVSVIDVLSLKAPGVLELTADRLKVRLVEVVPEIVVTVKVAFWMVTPAGMFRLRNRNRPSNRLVPSPPRALSVVFAPSQEVVLAAALAEQVLSLFM
ncbi:hypothetical protein D3C76_681310 [compost metagenome]